jgi:hypothetical protein
MLQKLRMGPGFRVAIALAAFAVVCFLAPPAVMAFGHGSHTVQCLAHADAVGHGVHGSTKDGDHRGHSSLPNDHHSCCRLVCLSALPLASGPLVEDRSSRPMPSALVEINLRDRVPERPDRPPISLLSV